MLEWYDFTVYALFAGYIAGNFFPGDDKNTRLLKTFLVFGLGFVVRPLGAVLIGNYGDRAGRKAALTLTILLMAAGTGIIALSPTYAAIGIGAPLLLLLGRVLQGFSAGGEIGGATAYLLESAEPAQRGRVASWLEASMGMANILGALAAFSVTALLEHERGAEPGAGGFPLSLVSPSRRWDCTCAAAWMKPTPSRPKSASAATQQSPRRPCSRYFAATGAACSSAFASPCCGRSRCMY